ncbi:MAG: hypothetical protein MUD17_10060, partial [Gemmatimonadaceae bacterium]|nr:hypothetical protein [Gemmatimonadaceae bacterium]
PFYLPAMAAQSSLPESFTGRLEHSFTLIAEFVPALFGALVILFAGYLLAKLVEKGSHRLLRAMKFNALLDRGGVLEAVARSGTPINPARVVSAFLFWGVMFSVLLVAANAIGLESLAAVFSELLSYIPGIIAALVIVIVGIVLGEFVEGLLRAAAGAVDGGAVIARIGRVSVVVLAVFMALQELGVATDIVTTAFAILFGAVALALGLAFGLGNRELAGEITRSWYGRYRAEREKVEREAAAEEAEEFAETAEHPTSTTPTRPPAAVSAVPPMADAPVEPDAAIR